MDDQELQVQETPSNDAILLVKIEGEDGEIREIVFVAKLVKRSPKFRSR